MTLRPVLENGKQKRSGCGEDGEGRQRGTEQGVVMHLAVISFRNPGHCRTARMFEIGDFDLSHRDIPFVFDRREGPVFALGSRMSALAK